MAFGPNNLRAHQDASQRSILISFKSASKKTGQDHAKESKKKKKKETRQYEREGHVVLLTIHQYPSVLKAWLRSPVVKYVDEERRKTAREIGGRSD